MSTWIRDQLPRIRLKTWALSFAWIRLGRWGIAITKREDY